LLILFVIRQDMYALCRVFKKNVTFGEIEKQGECSASKAKGNQEQLPNFGDVGQTSTSSEQGKDNSWMQFIDDGLWSNKTK
jgi:hypothetical protein